MNNKAIQAAIKILDVAQTAVAKDFLPGAGYHGMALANHRPWLFLYDAERSLKAQLKPEDEFDGLFEPRSYRP